MTCSPEQSAIKTKTVAVMVRVPADTLEILRAAARDDLRSNTNAAAVVFAVAYTAKVFKGNGTTETPERSASR